MRSIPRFYTLSLSPRLCHLVLIHDTLQDSILTQTTFRRDTRKLSSLDKLAAILAALFDVDEENGDHGSGANGEEEWEAHPVVPGVVYDGLDDVRADDGGGSVGDSEQSEEHVVVAAGHELADHCLGILYAGEKIEGQVNGAGTYGVVWSLEESEDDVVKIEFPLFGHVSVESSTQRYTHALL